MKNLSKVLTLILAVSFIATGCNLLNKEEVASTTAEVVSADTVLDQQIYKRAIDSKDAKACDTIKNEDVKTECGDVVNALVLTDKAVAELDDGFCGDIKLERYEEECENRVKSILEQKKEEEKKAELAAKQEENRLEIEAEAIEKQDYKICDEIKDLNQKESCRFNSTIDLAVSNKNAKQCENIGNIDLTNQCKQIVEANAMNLDQSK